MWQALFFLWMEQPKVPKHFHIALKNVRQGLKLGWNKIMKRFFIAHVHEHTKQTRIVCIVENDDGTFRMPDARDIAFLNKNIAWDLIDQYPEAKDMANYFIRGKAERKEKALKNRREWVKDFVRDNRRGIKQAVNRMIYDGITSDPVKPKDRRIQVDFSNVKSSGYSQNDSGILLPVFQKKE